MKDQLKELCPAIGVPVQRSLTKKASSAREPSDFDTGSPQNTLNKGMEVTNILVPPAYDAVYRMGRVIQLTGLSRSSIYRLEALGLFPARIKLAASASGWRSKDVHSWISNRPLAAATRGMK
ncbi:helix-turn-helix transcriptional regulator [Nitrosovibrio sp. Nv4]|uniref:helix-turn-helix transcriptional regulator n=1 Tax=Nitrosovibrio sp. Nv4 TaxID=1945880 RepID=UPI000BD929A8|nr:AlpA family phage regulatory protein [Nitrosovibrio sp. Nv4]SOD42223.1 transcriptional regulator, AlpA family [Nitrosovibrio sp. Nv4]